MPLTVVILGMHRSGTSWLTRTLQTAGLYLGADLLNAGTTLSDNLEGHAEAQEAVLINERMLELSGGNWKEVPTELRSDEATTSRILHFLETLGGRPVSGWKDPRTTLTFPLWKPHLFDYRLVACFRHPMSVARSLQVRENFSLEEGLHLWTAYNERLLQHGEEEAATHWVDYDASVEDRTRTLETLCASLGLRCAALSRQVYNPYLRHHAHSELPNDPRIRQLYERLRAHASRDWLDGSGGDPANNDSWPRTHPPARANASAEFRSGWERDLPPLAAAARPPEVGRLAGTASLEEGQSPGEAEWSASPGELTSATNRRAALDAERQPHIAQLARVVRLQNLAVQQIDHRIRGMHQTQGVLAADFQQRLAQSQQEILELRRQLAETNAQVQQLEGRLLECQLLVSECHFFVSRMRASFFFRLRRGAAHLIRHASRRLRQWLRK